VKSKAHGEISRAVVGSGNRAARKQNKPWGKMPEIKSDVSSGRVDTGGGHLKTRRLRPLASRGISPLADTGKNDANVKPKNRRQVR
jgi:hypothetical protein